MPRWKDLDIGMLTPRSMQPEDGRHIFTALQELLPAFFPYRFDNVEPLRQKMEIPDIEILLAAWDGLVAWSSKKHSAEGSLWTKSYSHTHSALFLSGKSGHVDLVHIVEFVQRCARLLRPDLAYLHLFTEKEFATSPYDMCMEYRQGLVTPVIRQYLPDLCWATVFGPPYVRLFGREVLLAAPVYRVEELAEELIYVQLSEHLTDLLKDYPAVDAIRQRLKHHLDITAFLDSEKGKFHTYQTPEFVIAP